MELCKHYFCVRMLLVQSEPKQEGTCLYVGITVYGCVTQVKCFNNLTIDFQYIEIYLDQRGLDYGATFEKELLV